MAIEIERKFLVKNSSQYKHFPFSYIKQGYLSTDPERTVRIRIVENVAFLTIKGKEKNCSRLEFEYKIPISDAEQMLRFSVSKIIEKKRFRIPLTQELTLEVDEFLGCHKGLILAEIELPSPDFPINLPDWIGQEVTGDKHYYNSYLSQNEI